MAEKEVVETSEAQIAVHWAEEDYYYPSYEFVAQANMTDPAVYDKFSLDNFASRNMLIFSTGMNTGIQSLIQATHHAGSGLSAGKSMQAIIALTGILQRTRTKRQSILFPNPWKKNMNI